MKELALENLARLTENSYPGRGIVIGWDESGKHFVQIYWIMGRSANSRNRVFSLDSFSIARAMDFYYVFV